MEKKVSVKIIATVVAIGFVVLVVAIALLIFLPRGFSNVAGVGELKDVNAIVYKTSPCCGYMEGAEFEATLTDIETIDRIVGQFNIAKMKLTMPIIAAGGSNVELIFRTESGDETVKFSRGKIGGYQFTTPQNALTELSNMFSRPSIYMSGIYTTWTPLESVRLKTYSDYENFTDLLVGYDKNNSDVTLDFFDRNYIAVVNLAEGSSSRQFYLTKISRSVEGVYTLKISNMTKNPSTDDVVSRVAMIVLPKNIAENSLMFVVSYGSL